MNTLRGSLVPAGEGHRQRLVKHSAEHLAGYVLLPALLSRRFRKSVEGFHEVGLSHCHHRAPERRLFARHLLANLDEGVPRLGHVDVREAVADGLHPLPVLLFVAQGLHEGPPAPGRLHQ